MFVIQLYRSGQKYYLADWNVVGDPNLTSNPDQAKKFKSKSEANRIGFQILKSESFVITEV